LFIFQLVPIQTLGGWDIPQSRATHDPAAGAIERRSVAWSARIVQADVV
jgi:hypothetical protein